MHAEQFGSIVQYDFISYAMPVGGPGKPRQGLAVSLLRLGVSDIPDTRGLEILDQNGNGVFDDVSVLDERVGRTAIPVRHALADIGRQEPHATIPPVQIPRLPDSDVVLQGERRVLREDADTEEPRVGAIREGEVDDTVFSAEGERGGGSNAAERVEPLALSTGEDQNQDRRIHGLELRSECVRPRHTMTRVEVAVVEVGVVETELADANARAGGEIPGFESGPEREFPLQPVFDARVKIEGHSPEMRLARQLLVGESDLHVERGGDHVSPAAERTRLRGSHAERWSDELARPGIPENL